MYLKAFFMLQCVVVLAIVYMIYAVVYRLYFHPLARFPGPKLASITYWYEFYYDIIRRGQYTFKLRELHEKYGSVIRINPDDLHFNDPDFHDEIFNSSGGKVEKPYKEANCFGPYPATIGTIDHDLHRVRRSALNPFFSKRSVNDLAPFIQNIVDALCARFDDAAKTGEPIDLRFAYAALTLDVMGEFCFSKSFNAVQIPDFKQRSFEDLQVFLEMSLVTLHLPWMIGALYSLPEWFCKMVSTAMKDMFDGREELSQQVESIRSGKDKSYQDSGHTTVFHSLLQSNLPEPEKRRERLRDEAFSLVHAGSASTAAFFKFTTYHVMANATVRLKLLDELKTVMPNSHDRAELKTLEQLPYLTAIILESLRVNRIVSHRMMRAFPEKTLKYREFEVPSGTIVSMTAILLHENEAIFPEPHIFRPERWLHGSQDRLQRYLVPFSRGTRGCLGINLAWAEMYLTLASVFRRFDFDLSQVVRERDIDCSRDCIFGVPSFDSKGIIVKVLSRSD